MALKRTFDDMNSNGNGFQADPSLLTSMKKEPDERQYDYSFLSKENHCGGPQETLEQLRKRLPQIERSSPKHGQSQDQQISLSNLKSVDTPLNFLSLGPGDHSDPSFGPVQGFLPGQGVCAQGHTDKKIRSGLSKGKQPSAQLTIFYSGVVNVYDNIPADDAYSIMLLAGTASSLPPQFMNLPSSENIFSVPSSGVTTATMPQLTHVTEIKHQAVRQSPAELPLARKASLARFLEERKDRIIRQKITADKTTDVSSQIPDLNPSLKQKSGNPKRQCSKPPNGMIPLAGHDPARDQESTASTDSKGTPRTPQCVGC